MAILIQDVAIIGSAYTGAALAIQLLRRLPEGSSLVLFGPKDELGQGVAYGTDRIEHLLNVRATNMSAIAEEPDHFVRWLEENGPTEGWDRGADTGEDADLYVPRLIYGRYIRATLNAEIARAGERVRVTIIGQRVKDMSRGGDSYAVRTADGVTYGFHNVALAMGPGSPVLPLRPGAVAGNAAERVIADPFGDARVRDIGPDARVFLLGTGLTMVDQILALRARGHEGTITALSRRGLLPSAHRRKGSPPVPFPMPEDGIRLTQLFAAVKKAARETHASGGDWRTIIDGLRPVTQKLWKQFSDEDRRRFGRHLASIWSVHRHRMAAQIADQVSAERAAGTTQIIAGRVLGIDSAADGSVVVEMRERGETGSRRNVFDWVINCSGTSASWQHEPVLANLLSAGDAVVNPYGGLNVNDDAVVTDNEGAATDGLFALGPMSRGNFLEITAVPDIRVQVGAVAERIAGRVSGAVV